MPHKVAGLIDGGRIWILNHESNQPVSTVNYNHTLGSDRGNVAGLTDLITMFSAPLQLFEDENGSVVVEDITINRFFHLQSCWMILQLKARSDTHVCNFGTRQRSRQALPALFEHG